MATIEQAIYLNENMSATFDRISKAVDASIGAMNRAVQSATRIESAVRSVQPAANTFNIVQNAVKAVGARMSEACDNIIQLRNKAQTSLRAAIDEAKKLNDTLEETGGQAQNAGNMISRFFASAAGRMSAAFSLGGLVNNAISTIVSTLSQIPKKLMAVSDMYSGTMARLNLIAGSAQKAAEMNDAIYYSALRARGSYETMADSVAKIGLTAREAFPDPSEVVPFVEGIQKLFAIGGTDTMQQQSAMLQLTQALGSNRLQGDEFRSISEAAPMIQQMVAKHLGVSIGALKELSTKGALTADILKNAILTNLDEINEKFAAAPMRWGQHWQTIETIAFRAFVPVYNQLEELANSPSMKSFVNMVVFGIGIAADAVSGLITLVRNVSTAIAGMLKPIAPAIMFLGGAFLFLGAQMLWSAAASALTSLNFGVLTIAGIKATWATIMQTYAQHGLNAAILACPLLWIIGLVVALALVIYALVAAFNYAAGTSLSATGVIRGAFAFTFAQIRNNVAFVVNVFASFAEWLGNLFVDPLGATYNLFADIWNNIIQLVGQAVGSILEMIGKIPGMRNIAKFDASMYTLEKREITGGIKLDRMAYANPADYAVSGYNWEFPELTFPEMKKPEITIPGMGDIADSSKNTAKNTGKMAEAMEITEEELKYLRDFANQEAINRYTTAEVKIEMGGINNNVSSGVDLDGMMTYINDSLFNAMQAGAERVSAV